MIWEKKLSEWQTANLLDEQTVKAIQDYEAQRSSDRPYVLYAFLSLGLVAILVGIISLIAFNWQDIPDSIKLALDFLVFFGLAIGILLSYQYKRFLVFEALIVIFCLWIPASLGLISQIFNQSGELYDALLLSCALSLPLVLFSRKALPGHLWLAALVFASYEGIFERLFDQEGLYFASILAGTFLLLGTILNHKATRELPLRRALYAWGLIILTGAVTIFSFHETDFNPNTVVLLMDLIFGALILGVAYAWSGWRWPPILMLALVTVFASLLLSASLHDSQWLLALSCIAVFLALAAFFANQHHEKLFHFFMISAGLRIYAVYLEVFGDLAETGLGLIVSGLVFIAMGLGYWFLRKRLAQLAQNIDPDFEP